MDGTGAYTADRASALSGVPVSTIHWWSRHGILAPSVSASRVKLWSYTDLMALRVIYWLRRQKTDAAGAKIPPTSLQAVRRALSGLQEVDGALWDEVEPHLFVDKAGKIYFDRKGKLQNLRGQIESGDLLNLIAPFTTIEKLRGPDLARPKPTLRILPGKLSGSPHVEGTRIETVALSSLASAGVDIGGIIRLYPCLTHNQVSEAIELEQELTQNARIAA